MKTYAAVLVAAVLAPMDEEVTRLAVAFSGRETDAGGAAADHAHGPLSGLGRNDSWGQQRGAGCEHPGPDTKGPCEDTLAGEWSEFWQKAFRAAVLKGYS